MIILCFHQLESSSDPIATSPELFRAQMHWLVRHGYRALTLGEFETAVEKRRFGAKEVLITFDDGYKSVFEAGVPILEELGFPAVNFLITCKIGEPGHLSWEQVDAMERSGLFRAQSHSHSHAQWLSVGEVIADLAASRNTLERRLSLPPHNLQHLAWPWGRALPGWQEAAEIEGFSYQYVVRTCSVRYVGDSKLELPRVCCDGMSITRFATTMRLLSNPWGAGFARLATRCWRLTKHGLGGVR